MDEGELRVTHDELLDCVKPEYAYGKIGDALRAVVELHKSNDDGLTCDECTASETEWYPCSTIQAIEKELK